MEFTFTVKPSRQSILLIDQLMENYAEIHAFPCAREICFVTHELVINAVEAMENHGCSDSIELHVRNENEHLHITMTDFAEGIPKEQWPLFLDMRTEDDSFCERGRGFFFIRHMVDQLWFEELPDSGFLVGVKKKIIPAEEK